MKDSGTGIDFILGIMGTPCLMLAECKRVDPAFSDWLFFKSPYIRGMKWHWHAFQHSPGKTASVRLSRLLRLRDQNARPVIEPKFPPVSGPVYIMNE